ncbi:MAG TPA: MoaD/ThiS family protein [Candidatus Krumholzibacteriaceae bacterium]|jgi:molybdopterin converting factor small subunit|nr:MoaD/ThiS family protein [Candidatus Krumholzibacteriaceae bacterium]
MLTVTVKFVGVLHQVFKKKQVKLKFARSPTVKEVIENLAETSSEARKNVLETESSQIHPALLVLVNGKEISALNKADTRVRDSDEIVLISVSHGG